MLAPSHALSFALLAALTPPPAALTAAQEGRRTVIVDVVRAQRDGVVALVATHAVPDGGRQIVGSGSVIEASGYVLTSARVVAMASELSVVLANGLALPARLVGAVPEEDLALLKVEVPRGVVLHAVSLGGDDLMIGEALIGMGAAGVSSSILAARDREGLLQTDKASLASSAGGPWFDAAGAQVGVTTLLPGESAGFAIGIERVNTFLLRVLALEGRRRLHLGLRVSGERNAPDRGGVTVASVERGSPAGEAGLAPGMVIVAVDGRQTSSLIEVLVALFEVPAAASFKVRAVLPEGTTDSFDITVAPRPAVDGKTIARARLGLELNDLDAAAAAQLGLRAGAGVMVSAVNAGSSAARAGIARGDVVTRVGVYGIATLADLAVLADLKVETRVPVRTVRIIGSRVQPLEADVLLR